MTTRRLPRAVAVALAVALLFTAGAATAADASPFQVQTKKYANCTVLKKVYKGGVAKSKTTVNKIKGKKKNGLKKTTKVSAKLYNENRHLDRDKDGWACE